MEFYSHLQTGKADFAFILNQKINSPYIHNYFQLPIRIGIYASPKNSSLNKSVIDISDFEQIPLLLTGIGCPYREAFLSLLEDATISPYIVLETSSLQVIKEMAICGIGVCVLPEIAVSKELKSKSLISLPLPFDITLNASLLSHKDKILSSHQKEFIKTLVAQVTLS